MASKEEINLKYYTKEGIEALITRAKSLCKLFNDNKFPLSVYILGFGNLKLANKEECLNRINELSDLTGFRAKVTRVQTENETKEVIEY